MRGRDQVDAVCALRDELEENLPQPRGERTLPKFSWLILPFWQNTQPRLQPEKKTQPAPFVPLSTGSSHWWSMAFAATMPAGMARDSPPRVSVRSAPQRRGQILQSISRLSPVR
ncbi:MAG: hypothetical protein ACLSHJ_08710 [Oscillospiraceae bacterium]